MSKPKKANILCSILAEKITEEFKNFDLILSPAMGGVVIGYEIGRIINKETIFAERVKGQFNLRRDFSIKRRSKSIDCRRCYNNWEIKFRMFKTC